MVYEAIRELVRYGLEKGLITEDDAIYARNQILEVLKMDEYEEPEKDGELTGAALEKILKVLLDYAAEKGLLQENSVVYRDLFDTKLMNCLMPRPSEVTKTFWEKYQVSPETAHRLLLQPEPEFRLYPQIPCKQGYEMDHRYQIRYTGYHSQLIQTGKRSKGYCSSETGKAERLSKVSALYGKYRLCRQSEPSGKK